MENIELIVPSLEDYWYEQKLLNDSDTMSYNAGYEVSYKDYHYESGCIDYPKTKWEDKYNERNSNNNYYAYIKDNNINKYVGFTYYIYNEELKRYDCGIVVESSLRNLGYGHHALTLLIETAKKNNIDALYDSFEIDRESALKLFTDLGFEISEQEKIKKFNEEVNGVLLKLNLN